MKTKTTKTTRAAKAKAKAKETVARAKATPKAVPSARPMTTRNTLKDTPKAPVVRRPAVAKRRDVGVDPFPNDGMARTSRVSKRSNRSMPELERLPEDDSPDANSGGAGDVTYVETLKVHKALGVTREIGDRYAVPRTDASRLIKAELVQRTSALT